MTDYEAWWADFKSGRVGFVIQMEREKVRSYRAFCHGQQHGSAYNTIRIPAVFWAKGGQVMTEGTEKILAPFNEEAQDLYLDEVLAFMEVQRFTQQAMYLLHCQSVWELIKARALAKEQRAEGSRAIPPSYFK